MGYVNKFCNITLGGGGIKGIAYVGMYEIAERRGYRFGNIAGVSAGSIAGAYMAAGYNYLELRKIMQEFDFEKVDLIRDIPEKVPAVAKFMDYAGELRTGSKDIIFEFLNISEALDYRANIFKTMITYMQEGCLFDGDYLEEWVAKVLAQRGIKTFADLRGGIPDEGNPHGYKVRMTGVDCNRMKIITLPDDISFYGINPDDLEVAKAVRISTSVPFAFKPVTIKKEEGDKTVTYNLIDGGVFDSLPSRLMDSSRIPLIGYTLAGGAKKKIFSLGTAVDIFKSIVSAIYEIEGFNKGDPNLKYLGKIDTSKVSFLEFGLNTREKDYLYNSGKMSAISVFNDFEHNYPYHRILSEG